MSQLIRMVKAHEGAVRNEAGLHTVYLCSEGYPTIGYGYNITANPLSIDYDWRKGIDDYMADHLLEEVLKKEIRRLRNEFVKIPVEGWDTEAAMVREDVLADMAFNLGFNGLKKFSKMINAIKVGDFDEAARQMLNSKWARQVGNRATELAEMMKTGKYVKEY